MTSGFCPASRFGLCLGLVAGCNAPVKPNTNISANTDPPKPAGEPDYIKLQHILIGFEGSVRGKRIERTKEEAKERAEKILKFAQDGEDFDELVKSFTDDSAPGIYNVANYGLPGDKSSDDPSNHVYKRSGMAHAFGDVGFPLEVGEIGMASHHEKFSPYGWHIIKRLE